MKPLKMLVVFILFVSLTMLFMSGCTKKQEAEQQTPETERMQSAPADTITPPPPPPQGEDQGAEEAPQETTE